MNAHITPFEEGFILVLDAPGKPTAWFATWQEALSASLDSVRYMLADPAAWGFPG